MYIHFYVECIQIKHWCIKLSQITHSFLLDVFTLFYGLDKKKNKEYIQLKQEKNSWT